MTYTVELKYQFEREPYRYVIEAASKRSAIEAAQSEAKRDGHYGHGAGIGLGRSVWRAIPHTPYC